MEQWSIDVVERPNQVFGNLPLCPFAKRARMDDKVRWEVVQYQMGPAADEVIKLIRDFEPAIHDIMIIINPDTHPSIDEFFKFVEQQLQPAAAAYGLECLGAYPDDPQWSIAGWVTKWPYQCLLTSTKDLLKKYSDRLMKTKYYQNWTEEQLREFGLPRRK